MLDETLKTQLGAYLERVQQPFEIVASLDDSENSRDTLSLLQTIQGLRSDKITLRVDGNDARKPSFSLQRTGSTSSLRFAGLPLGHEFTSLVSGVAVDRWPPAQGRSRCDRPDQGA